VKQEAPDTFTGLLEDVARRKGTAVPDSERDQLMLVAERSKGYAMVVWWIGQGAEYVAAIESEHGSSDHTERLMAFH